jgi:hypothetical protein
MSTDKAVTSAAALAEVDAVVVMLADSPTGSEISTVDDSCYRPTGLLTAD